MRSWSWTAAASSTTAATATLWRAPAFTRIYGRRRPETWARESEGARGGIPHGLGGRLRDRDARAAGARPRHALLPARADRGRRGLGEPVAYRPHRHGAGARHHERAADRDPGARDLGRALDRCARRPIGDERRSPGVARSDLRRGRFEPGEAAPGEPERRGRAPGIGDGGQTVSRKTRGEGLRRGREAAGRYLREARGRVSVAPRRLARRRLAH